MTMPDKAFILAAGLVLIAMGAVAAFLFLGGGDDELAERRHDLQRRRTDHRRIGGHVTPCQDLEALFGADLVDRGRSGVGARRVARQEEVADRVVPRGGQLDVELCAQEGVGHLDQDAGAVAGVLLGAGDVVFLRNATMLCAVLGCLPAIWLSLAYDWGLAGIWAGLTVFVVLRMVAVSWRAFSGKWAVTGPATAKRGSLTEEAEGSWQQS